MQSSGTKLTGEQKQAIGLLSIGTFLEYFDLMLYVHMAILLNELFFPKTDPFTLSLISAIAFCSSYVLRPVGALIFGYIGDHIGRKHTVVITTLLMSISCVIMANLPTYEQIGITAAWLVTICRMIQGISSIGEITGSQLYLTEITTPPIQYPVVALILLASSVGSVTALGVASLCSAYGFNWRIAFWIGAGIALVGSYARSALRETPEFVNAKLRLKRIFEDAGKNPQLLKNNYIIKEKVNKKVVLSLFLIDCALPVFFYLTYIHFGNFLKNTFNYSGSEVIYHNFKVGLIYLACAIIQTYLSYKIHPLKILRTRMQIFAIFILLYPYLLGNISTPFHLLIFQACIIVFAPSNFPAVSVFFKHIPIFKRFTYSSVLHAVSHALIYVVTSFGLIYLVKQFGQTGVLIIIIPICVGFIYGMRYFEKLEKETGNYPQKDTSCVSSDERELA
jgi:MHS family proline/betaine transporter-like MFS transporter